MSETPVGKRPETGGRLREYATSAERSRAWRQRQREQAAEDDVVLGPAMAPAGLAATLDGLRELLSGHRDALDAQVARVEGSIAVLADPEAVDEALEASRAAAARQVAEADERAAEARRALSATEADARIAREERQQATDAANGAWDRVEELEAALAERDARLADAEHSAVQAREAHTAALAEQAAAHEEELTRLRQRAGAREAELTRQAERAEATTTAIRDELGRAHQELERVRTEYAAALAETRAEAEASRTAAVAAAVAPHEGMVTGLQARLAAADELAQARLGELDRSRAEITRLADLLDALTPGRDAPPRAAGKRGKDGGSRQP